MIKNQVCKSDMFYATEMLRYDADSQYKTFTGGILSIGICATIIIAFASMIQDTFNRSVITYSLQALKQDEPTLVDLTPKEGFMIAFEVSSFDYSFNIDLTGPVRYFDAHLYLKHQ
jgi:hypothetical protein